MRFVTTYEVALLVFVAVLVITLLVREVQVRGQLEDMRLTLDVHQKHLAELGKVDGFQQTSIDNHLAMLKRLDEQTGKISKRAEQFRQAQPDFTRLRADMDRLLKADMHRRAASGVWDHQENKFSGKEPV